MRSWASSCWPQRCSTIGSGDRPQRHVEGIGQRVGRVGRQHHRAEAGVGAPHRGRRGRGRLADPALAREQQDAGHCCCNVGAQLAEGGVDDLLLGPTLDEPGQGTTSSTARWYVTSVRPGVTGGLQLVAAVELAHDVAPHERPAQAILAVVVPQRVAGAPAHGGGAERDLVGSTLVVEGVDRDPLEVLRPGRVGGEVEQDLEDRLRGRRDLHRLRRLVSHQRILVQPRPAGPHARVRAADRGGRPGTRRSGRPTSAIIPRPNIGARIPKATSVKGRIDAATTTASTSTARAQWKARRIGIRRGGPGQEEQARDVDQLGATPRDAERVRPEQGAGAHHEQHAGEGRVHRAEAIGRGARRDARRDQPGR